MARIMQKSWSDDGRFICQNFHAVRAAAPSRDALVAAWTNVGLSPYLRRPPRGESAPKLYRRAGKLEPAEVG
eukprot:5841457-Pyramimonas_sp.AAC.1